MAYHNLILEKLKYFLSEAAVLAKLIFSIKASLVLQAALPEVFLEILSAVYSNQEQSWQQEEELDHNTEAVRLLLIAQSNQLFKRGFWLLKVLLEYDQEK